MTSKIELSEAQIRTSMKSLEHMKRWLEASGRRYLVFDALELVSALPWPEGHVSLTQIIACHRDYRVLSETGRFEDATDPTDGKKVGLPIYKGETLELEELDRAIRYLIGVATDKARERGIKWDINHQPL